jgi:hypothetical protein
MRSAENNGGKISAFTFDRGFGDDLNGKSLNSQFAYRSMWRFWIDHPMGVFFLSAGFTLMTPMLESPDENPRRLWFAAGGACALATALMLWAGWIFISAMRDVKSRPQAQLNGLKKTVADMQLKIADQDRPYRQAIQLQLDGLKRSMAEMQDQILASAARRLTNDQSKAIIKTMSAFKGEKIYVQALLGANDAINFAKDFVAAFKAAGMDCDRSRTTLNVEDFDNLIVSMSKEDADCGNYPLAWWALSYELANFGFTMDPAMFMSEPDLKRGEIRLQIGVNPGRKAAPPACKYFYTTENGRVVSQGVEEPLGHSASRG